MVRQELVLYLREGLRKGFSLDLLEENLTKEGWPIQLVVEASNLIRSERKETIKKLPVTEIDFNLDIPIGIKLIAVLHYLFSLGVVFFGAYIAFIKDISFLFEGIQTSNLSHLFSGIIQTPDLSYTVFGISIFIAFIPFIIGLGIRRGKKIARIIFTFLAIILIVLNIYYTLGIGALEKVYLFLIIIPITIIGYLFFNKKSKRHFS